MSQTARKTTVRREPAKKGAGIAAARLTATKKAQERAAVAEAHAIALKKGARPTAKKVKKPPRTTAKKRLGEELRKAQEELEREKKHAREVEEAMRALQQQLLSLRKKEREKRVHAPKETRDRLVPVHAPREAKTETVTEEKLVAEIIEKFAGREVLRFDFRGKTYEQQVDVLKLPPEQLQEFFLEKTNKFLGERTVASLTPNERRKLREFEAMLLNALIKCDSEFQSRERFITTFYAMGYSIFQKSKGFEQRRKEVEYILNEAAAAMRKTRLVNAEKAIERELVMFEHEKKVLKFCIRMLAPLIKDFDARKNRIAELKKKFEERRFGLFKTNRTLTEYLTSKEEGKLLSPMKTRLLAIGVAIIAAALSALMAYVGAGAWHSDNAQEVRKNERAAYACYFENLREPPAAIEETLCVATGSLEIKTLRDEFMFTTTFNEHTLPRLLQVFEFIRNKDIVKGWAGDTPIRWVEYRSEGRIVKFGCPLTPTQVLAVRRAVCRDYAELLAGMVKTLGVKFRFKFYLPEKDSATPVPHVNVQAAFKYDGSLEQAKKAIEKQVKKRYAGNVVINGVEEGETPGLFWLTLDPGYEHAARYDGHPGLTIKKILTPTIDELIGAQRNGG